MLYCLLIWQRMERFQNQSILFKQLFYHKMCLVGFFCHYRYILSINNLIISSHSKFVFSTFRWLRPFQKTICWSNLCYNADINGLQRDSCYICNHYICNKNALTELKKVGSWSLLYMLPVKKEIGDISWSTRTNPVQNVRRRFQKNHS